MRPAVERVPEKVDSTDPERCWQFHGANNGLGYGRVSVGRKVDGTKRLEYTHRVVYESMVGPIPEGLTLDHLCRNPSCVNPAHLEPVTRADNIRRSHAARARRCRDGD